MARVVNLDALKAAREEALGGNTVVVIGGREFKVVGEMPIDAALQYRRAFDAQAKGNEDIEAAHEFMRLMLADPTEAADFFVAGATWADLVALISGLGDPGESSASQPSAPKGGKRSRPTSPRTTKST